MAAVGRLVNRSLADRTEDKAVVNFQGIAAVGRSQGIVAAGNRKPDAAALDIAALGTAALGIVVLSIAVSDIAVTALDAARDMLVVGYCRPSSMFEVEWTGMPVPDGRDWLLEPHAENRLSIVPNFAR
jgi:hypothetical protein